MAADFESILTMLVCTGFIIICANLIASGFEAILAKRRSVAAGNTRAITDERYLLPEGRGENEDLL